VVPCTVDIMDQVDYVQNGSLVGEDGRLKADIFFGAAKRASLAQEEADELARFVENGGVLYITSVPSDVGTEYNLLFEALGINDRFSEDVFTGELAQTTTPIESIITQGLFGSVGPLSSSSVKIFNNQWLQGIASRTEAEEHVVYEGRIGKGYLVVTGSWLYSDFLIDLDNDNRDYYLNLFALGCDKSWQDNSVVLEVPSFKQGLLPYDNSDPYWENQTYDDGNNLDLWCDTDKNGAKMYECACALTSASMVMNYHNVTKTPLGTPLDLHT
jgi:hypothetical protein